jgi:hypothetical protein
MVFFFLQKEETVVRTVCFYGNRADKTRKVPLGMMIKPNTNSNG